MIIRQKAPTHLSVQYPKINLEIKNILLIFAVEKQRQGIMKLFTDIKFHTDTNNWYAPLCEFWGSHKSVHTAEYMDKTSSAGDWSGYILQRVGNNVYAIGFSQENDYPHDGFTLYTCEVPFFIGNPENPNFIDDCEKCWNQFDIQ